MDAATRAFVTAYVARGAISTGGDDDSTPAFLSALPLPRLLSLLAGAATPPGDVLPDAEEDALASSLGLPPTHDSSLLCAALDRVLCSRTPGLDDAVLPLLPSALGGASPRLRSTALKYATRCAGGLRGVAARDALFEPAVLAALLGRLHDDEVALAEAAGGALAALAGAPAPSSPSQGFTVTPPSPSDANIATLANRLQEMVDGGEGEDSTLQLRLFSLCAKLAGAPGVPAPTLHALLRPLLAAVTGDDVLLQLNVIEALPSLAGSARGWDALVGCGGWGRLLEWAGLGVHSPEQDGLLGPAALAAVADAYAAVAGRDPTLPQSLRADGLPALLAVAGAA